MAEVVYPLLSRLFGTVSQPLPQPRRIVVLKTCCLGDVLMATALASALRQAWPSSHLAFATGPWSTAALLNNPHLDLVLTLPVDVVSPGETARLALLLRSHSFDWCLIPDRSPVLGLAARLAGIPVRIGLDSGGRAFACNLRVKVFPGHEMDLYLALARAVGIDPNGALPTFVPGQQAEEWARQFLSQKGLAEQSFAVLHPGGGDNPGAQMPSKRWPAVNYAWLADRLAAMGVHTVLVGADEDMQSAEEVAGAATSHPLNLAGRVSLAQVAALARRAALYVGNDTGVTHIAAAVGAPTLAIFGPTDPNRYAPRGQRVRALGGTRWDADLRRKAPPVPSFPTLEEVWEACRELLDVSDPPQPSPPAD
jgi:ADP-heptose:LPS heptosyltransferase